MSNSTLTPEAQPAPSALATLNRWIVDYNLAQVGDHGQGRLTILAHDQQQHLIGGIIGFTDRGWLRIELLVVQEHHRRAGIGARLLQMVEAEAQRRGCHSAWLDTFSFQALPFYQQRGYIIFGALDHYPDAHPLLRPKSTCDRQANGSDAYDVALF